jgi:hypothetical protein
MPSGKTFRYLFIVSAVIIAIASVWITNALVNKLKEEERKRIEIWIESIVLNSTMNSEEIDPGVFNDYNTLMKNIAEGNTTIPAILTNDSGELVDYKNLNLPEENQDEYIKTKIKKFANTHERIEAEVDEKLTLYVYYDDSTVLKQLQLFPFIQLAVVFIFIIISFLALNSTKKAEQNKFWVGLSK